MSTLKALREATNPTRIVRGHCIGRLFGWSLDGKPLVDYPESPHGPIPARMVEPVRKALRREVANLGAELLLVFEREQSDRPIIVATMASADGEEPTRSQSVDVVLDGRRLVLTAAEEIVLRCGEASICLRSNGRLILHGTYVESDSDGINRIKGGIVKVN